MQQYWLPEFQRYRWTLPYGVVACLARIHQRTEIGRKQQASIAITDSPITARANEPQAGTSLAKKHVRFFDVIHSGTKTRERQHLTTQETHQRKGVTFCGDVYGNTNELKVAPMP